MIAGILGENAAIASHLMLRHQLGTRRIAELLPWRASRRPPDVAARLDRDAKLPEGPAALAGGERHGDDGLHRLQARPRIDHQLEVDRLEVLADDLQAR